MFGLSTNESFILGVGSLWVYSSAVAALPEPTEKSSNFYTWVYKLLKSVAGDLSAKFGQYIPKVASILVFALMFSLTARSQTTTTTATATASNGFTASSDASAIYFNKAWGTGTHVTESYDLIDFGKTKANHVYVEGHELVASTAGFNIYAGGLAYEPNLSGFLNKTNVTSSNLGATFYAALGNGVPSTGGSHVSAIVGGQLKYKATSSLTWNALQASWLRFGPQNGYSISTGLSFIFGK
jgi:hypothetical protein